MIPRPPAPRWPLAVAGLLLAGCGPTLAAGGPCSPEGESHPLPLEVPESSGVAESGADPGVYWTHNDSGWDPELFAVDRRGRLLATVRVDGAENRDWEDLAAGPCPDGSRCLYVADTGDNRLTREGLVVYRVPEPPVRDGTASPVDSLALTLPDGPRDIEALFLLGVEDPDSVELHLITKGRAGPVEHYRYPAPLRPREVVEVEKLSRMSERAPLLPWMVTGAASSPDGALVAVRTYVDLRFHRPADDGTLSVAEATVNLRPLREPQGEAVAMGPDGKVVLTSEAGPGGDRGVLNVLRCRLPSRRSASPRRVWRPASDGRRARAPRGAAPAG